MEACGIAGLAGVKQGWDAYYAQCFTWLVRLAKMVLPLYNFVVRQLFDAQSIQTVKEGHLANH